MLASISFLLNWSVAVVPTGGLNVMVIKDATKIIKWPIMSVVWIADSTPSVVYPAVDIMFA